LLKNGESPCPQCGSTSRLIGLVLEETVTMTDSLFLEQESNYLINSNKEKCKKIFLSCNNNLNSLNENEIIDLYISLHIILEISLNALFRGISLLFIKKDINELDIIDNIDKINFIDKTVLFIYNSAFNFHNKLTEATHYHSLIGMLRSFAEARNKLLHGHSIRTISNGNEIRHSKLKAFICKEKLNEQIVKFRFICEGMRFFINSLDSNISKQQRETFINNYLDDNFILSPSLSQVQPS
jgi:hypothetical protein